MKEKDKLPHVLLVGMGGTIASVMTESGFAPRLAIERLVELVPELKRLATIHLLSVRQVDSSNLQPEDWSILATAIHDEVIRLEQEEGIELAGVVVSHGTDTMSYSATACAFMLQDLPFPIVFTGSQIPLSTIGTDGKKNLIDAFRVAVESDLAEVVIVFDSTIFRAVRTRKLREYELDAFESQDRPPLGMITRRIEIFDDHYKKRLDIPFSTAVEFKPELNKNILLIKVHPGLSPRTVKLFLETTESRGLILEGFGSGNLPIIGENSFLPLIEELRQKELPVIVSTQCFFGKTEMWLYETGKSIFEAGAIPSYDMNSEAALVKLMWIQGRTHRYEEIKRLFHHNFVGEIHVEREE